MTIIRLRMLAAAVLVPLFQVPAASLAQARLPDRQDNIWDWHDHQPTEAQVEQREKAAGVAPSPFQTDSESATLNQIYRRLLEHGEGRV